MSWVCVCWGGGCWKGKCLGVRENVLDGGCSGCVWGGGGMLEGKMFGVGENVYERISHRGGDRNV